MAEQIERLRGVRVPSEAFDVAKLPPHLRVTFMVEDGERGVLAADKTLERVREQVRPRLRGRADGRVRAARAHAASGAGRSARCRRA